MTSRTEIDSRADLIANQDDCLLAIEDGHPVPVAKLGKLPPWRAVMVARIAAKAGVPLERGTVDQLHAEAAEVGGAGDAWRMVGAAGMTGDENDSIWIQSTRGPDHEPACLITFGPLQYYASVEDVRTTAIDLVTCAAYAEMMMTLVVRVNLGADVVSRFATDLLSGAGRRCFGAKTTVLLTPAGSTKRREALVLLKRGSMDGALSPDEARAMALRWLATAEATESDQLVSEALRATGSDEAATEKLFGYLRELRSDKPAA